MYAKNVDIGKYGDHMTSTFSSALCGREGGREGVIKRLLFVHSHKS